jgi:predicted ATPase
MATPSGGSRPRLVLNRSIARLSCRRVGAGTPQRELSELQLLLKSVRLPTLTGAAGIGRTRLALEVAREAEPRFEHGAVFIDLAPVRDPLLMPQALAAALYLREDAHKTATETIQNHLNPQQLLVVLDNCEHLLQSAASVADSLIRSCVGVRFLATSREAMRIRGETVWPVPALRADEA